MIEPFISLKNISKDYHHRILDSIHLDIEKDKFIVILGPSGSGKTTLLRIIAGLDKAFEGTLESKISSKDVTMFFQSYALFPFLNVYENIALSLETYSKNEKKTIIERIAKDLKIDHLLKRSIQELSGGEAQRVALARTMASPASLCLMDEPLSHLDTTLQFDTMKLIKSIHLDKKWTTLYVTHQLKEALFLADTIVVMNEGRIEQIGTYDELYRHPNNVFVASFVSDFPINLFKGTLKNRQFKCHEFTLELNSTYEGPCFLGIRKEDLLLSNEKSSISIDKKDLNLSNSTYSQLKIEDKSVLMTMDLSIDLNQPLYLHMDLNKVHLFDINSKKI